jgi:hypothetical protein
MKEATNMKKCVSDRFCYSAVRLLIALAAIPLGLASTPGMTASMPRSGVANAVQWLIDVMDQFHRTGYVYQDSSSAGNHFNVRGKMGDVPTMLESWTDNPHSGIDCIKCEFRSAGNNWGGWYFMNGILEGTDIAPSENWGDKPNAGLDLSGATQLSFWARGETGGERVEFFCFGIGRNADTGEPIKPYPDSSAKRSLGYVTLTRDWKSYTLNLAGADLTYVLGGFGWATSAGQNNNRDIVFYLDDIQYDKSRLTEPRFLVSYKTVRSDNDVDAVMRNAAFTYDNALALLAFLAVGERQRAKLIADALVYAQQHDRYFNDGRLRNAYQAGDLRLWPGWTPYGKIATVRMPGWYDTATGHWVEDSFQVGSSTGNVAWAMLALVTYYQNYGGEAYLNAAKAMGEWVESNCRSTTGAGGYTGGYEGWEPSQTQLTYKATEHNIDLFAVFQHLYFITTDTVWSNRADHAKQFVKAMWDPVEKKFWTGTSDDGITINPDVIPLDAQAWANLALREETMPYLEALDYAESHLKVGEGFDFNEDRDGIWFEGTAQMASAWWLTSQPDKAQALIACIRAAQNPSGGIPAADRDGLTTGIYLSDGQPWLYHRRLHVGATAWLVLAETQQNAFWMTAPLVIEPGALIAGQAFSVSLKSTEDITQSFDFYLLAETSAGVYTIYFNGTVEKGIHALYRNVPGFSAPFSTTINSTVRIPPGMAGKTVTFYAVVVDAGKMPPVKRLSDLTPETLYVIMMDKETVPVGPPIGVIPLP